jgi:tight adherence protein C
MIVIGSLALFLTLTALLYLLGLNVWVSPKAVIDRVSGENWRAEAGGTRNLAFREILQKLGSAVPSSPGDTKLLQKRLLRAGLRSPNALKTMYGIKVALAVALPVAATLVTSRIDMDGNNRMMAIAAAAVVGYLAPNQVLKSLVKRRQKKVKRALPNALDLMVVCVESGLGLDQAIMQVSKELANAHPEISTEFALLNLELRHGLRRAEALRNLADRAGVEELKRLVGVLIQADKFGTSIALTLRNQSEYMRIASRQEAETRAAKIGIKLVFPIFFCILPALFVVTVGPVVVRIMRDLLPMMNSM